MAKTHTFSTRSGSRPVTVVLAHVILFERDEFAECTMISLTGGHKIGVSEGVDEVTKVIEAA